MLNVSTAVNVVVIYNGLPFTASGQQLASAGNLAYMIVTHWSYVSDIIVPLSDYTSNANVSNATLDNIDISMELI